MSTLLTRVSRTDPTRPRALCEGAALCDHGERCDRACSSKRRPIEPTPTSFWWAYALVLVAVVALVGACS